MGSSKKVDDMFFENYLVKLIDDQLKCYDLSEMLKLFNRSKNQVKLKQLQNNKDFMFIKSHMKYNIFNEVNIGEIPDDEM